MLDEDLVRGGVESRRTGGEQGRGGSGGGRGG